MLASAAGGRTFNSRQEARFVPEAPVGAGGATAEHVVQSRLDQSLLLLASCVEVWSGYKA